MVPPVTVDAARSLKALPLQARIDEDVEVLGVVVTGDIIGPKPSAYRVVVGGVQSRSERQRVAPTRTDQPHPVFLRDDFALVGAGEFSSFPCLDIGDQVPHALNSTRRWCGTVEIASGGYYRSGYSKQDRCGKQFVRHHPILALRGGCEGVQAWRLMYQPRIGTATEHY